MELPKMIRKKKNDIVKDLGSSFLWGLEKFIANNSKIPTTPILNKEMFEWSSILEDNWMNIRKELDQILKHKDAIPRFQDISQDQKSISKDDDWRTYFLYGFGYKAKKNCLRCPLTTSLIEQIPGMTTAFFSILNKGKHIPRHRGVFNGFIRYHLGLKIPEPAASCRMEIENYTFNWEEGKGVLFDDTYQHEVWNNSNDERVVLLVDVIRPLNFHANIINKALINTIKHSYYVQDAKKNQEKWENLLIERKLS